MNNHNIIDILNQKSFNCNSETNSLLKKYAIPNYFIVDSDVKQLPYYDKSNNDKCIDDETIDLLLDLINEDKKDNKKIKSNQILTRKRKRKNNEKPLKNTRKKNH